MHGLTLPYSQSIMPELELVIESGDNQYCAVNSSPAEDLVMRIRYVISGTNPPAKDGKAITFPSVPVKIDVIDPDGVIITTTSINTNSSGLGSYKLITGDKSGKYIVKAKIDEVIYPEFASRNATKFNVTFIELINIEATLPNADSSFTTLENNIRFNVDFRPDEFDSEYNPKIEWEIQDDPDIDGTTPVFDVSSIKGNEVNIVVDIPLVTVGRDYALNYKVRAKLVVNDKLTIYSSWKKIKQSEKDKLRQQYIDMSKNTTPAITEFVNVGSSTYFNLTEGACRCGNHSYHIWSIMSNLDAVRESFGQAMTVTSGYRCPIHNATVSTATESQHIYGTAADIRVLDFNKSGGEPDRADWELLRAVADQYATWIEEWDGILRVHMDWR
jgi:hypothetical protein